MKRAMSRFGGISLAVMLFALLTACGGGSSSSSVAPATGVFANVSGLGYSSGSQTGITGTSGKFTYLAGDTATFKVGDILIGQATAGSLLTPLHLFPGKDAADPGVVNAMRFLMSIGTYDAVNLTIKIPAAVLNAAKGKTIDFTTATDQELLDLVKLLTGNSNATLVDAATANGFLSKIIYKNYGGLYSGSFSGKASSTKWEMTIDSNGAVTGAGLDGAKETIIGNMTDGINLTALASGACNLSGKLNVSTGVLSGTWQYPATPDQNGTFTGTK